MESKAPDYSKIQIGDKFGGAMAGTVVHTTPENFFVEFERDIYKYGHSYGSGRWLCTLAAWPAYLKTL